MSLFKKKGEKKVTLEDVTDQLLKTHTELLQGLVQRVTALTDYTKSVNDLLYTITDFDSNVAAQMKRNAEMVCELSREVAEVKKKLGMTPTTTTHDVEMVR